MINLGQMVQVLRPHLFIGFVLLNRLTTLLEIVGLGSTLGGLELASGLLGMSLVTLLLTSTFASVLFRFFATIGFSSKICFRASS